MIPGQLTFDEAPKSVSPDTDLGRPVDERFTPTRSKCSSCRRPLHPIGSTGRLICANAQCTNPTTKEPK